MAARARKSRKSSKAAKIPKLKLKPMKITEKIDIEPIEPVSDKIREMKAARKPHLREMKMLEEGVIPAKNKIGKEFKGKNKVIIA